MGSELLLSGLQLRIEVGEKIGVIGRNGVGKTTLLNILDGSDREYDGDVAFRRGARLVSTRQEHLNLGDISALDYIITNLPEYAQLKHIVSTHPDHMGENIKKIHEFSEALERFNHLGYYEIEAITLRALASYQIDESKARSPFKQLSGGQKRLVELVRIQLSDADLALIDEPTNHMDFVAKATFIDWLHAAKGACAIITHDRDVLAHVDRIIEMKDKKAFSFKGNYQAYLKQNTQSTTNQMQNYEIAQKTIVNLKKQIAYAKARKPSWSGTADQKNPFVVMEKRLTKQLHEIEAANQKPSFWIDQESAAALSPKMTEKYQEYKSRNIRIGKSGAKERTTYLLRLDDVQVGWESPLFKPVNFNLAHGDRLQLVGRNGAGKTTLVKVITAVAKNKSSSALLHGEIEPSRQLRLAVYEQEVNGELMEMTLESALEHIYSEAGLPVNRQVIMQVMGEYLFDPIADAKKRMINLSGGQKARVQLIRMLASKPNLLILDEPTNHLDLPSIEELENALKNYHGAVMYVSHDSYFSKTVGGEQLRLQAVDV